MKMKAKLTLVLLVAVILVLTGIAQQVWAIEGVLTDERIVEETENNEEGEAESPVVNGDFTEYLTGFSFYNLDTNAEYGENNSVKDGDKVGIRFKFNLGNNPTENLGMTVGSTYTLPALPKEFNLSGTSIVGTEYDLGEYEFAKWTINDNGVITIRIVKENKLNNVTGYLGVQCYAAVANTEAEEIKFDLGKFIAEQSYQIEKPGEEAGKASVKVTKKGSINERGIISWEITAHADEDKPEETLAGYQINDTYNGSEQAYVAGSMKVDDASIKDSALDACGDGGFTYTFPENTTGRTAKITYQTQVKDKLWLDMGERSATNKVRLSNKEAYGEASATVLVKKTTLSKSGKNWRYNNGKYYADYTVNVNYLGNYKTVKLQDTIGVKGANFVADSVKIQYEGEASAQNVAAEDMTIEGNKLTVNLDRAKSKATVLYTIEIASLQGLTQSGGTVTVSNTANLLVSTTGTNESTVGTDSTSLAGKIDSGDGTTVDMAKVGNLEKSGKEILWRIRINLAKRELTDDVTITDTLDNSQTFKEDSIVVKYGNKITNRDNYICNIEGKVLTLTLKNVGKNVVDIQYKTEIGERNPSTQYSNTAKLNYRNVEVNTSGKVELPKWYEYLAKNGSYDSRTGIVNDRGFFNWRITFNSVGYEYENVAITDTLPAGHALDGKIYVNNVEISNVESDTKPYYVLENGNPVIRFPGKVTNKQIITLRTSVSIPKGTSTLNPTNTCRAVAKGLDLKAEANAWVSFNSSLEKTTNYTSGNSIVWEININKGGGNSHITKQNAVLTDRLHDALAYVEGTAKLTLQDIGLAGNQTLKVDYDEDTNELKLTMPDGLDLSKSYKVTFTTAIKYNVNGLQNTIIFDGTATTHGATSQAINLQAVGVESGITGDNIRLDLTKVDVDTKASLAGAVFALYGSEDEEIQRATSDSRGIISFTKDLSYGAAYTFKEIAPPDGYVLDDTVHTMTIAEQGNAGEVQVTIDGQTKSASQDANNTLQISHQVTNKKNEISFSKVEQTETGTKALAGATLTLFKLDDNGEKIEPAIESWTTGENPHLVKGLHVGNYVLVESEAPANYLLAKDITFSVDEKGSIQNVTNGTLDKDGSIQMVDVLAEEDTEIKFTKVEIVEGRAELLYGAELAVFQADSQGNKTGEAVARWISGKEVKVLTGVLEKEKTYVLSETKAPDGYAYAEDILFRITKNGEVEILKNGSLVNGSIQMIDVKLPPENPPVYPPTDPPVYPPVNPPVEPTTPELPEDEYLEEEETELPEDEYLEEEETDLPEDEYLEEEPTAEIVKTGDKTNLMLWIVLLFTSAAMAVTVIRYKKKKNE